MSEPVCVLNIELNHWYTFEAGCSMVWEIRVLVKKIIIRKGQQ